MKASILAIGTELTTGQILNSNAQNLSHKLKSLSVTVAAYLTVPDDKLIIMNSLRFLQSQLSGEGDLLFVTGGLGPTSDDLTRDVLADWSSLAMKFDQASWDSVVERLSARGFKVREMQRQQCYFPENSEILFNSEGTANAFKFNVNNITVYVLPGPPREIEAIWKDHVVDELIEKTKNLDKLITKAWDTIGIGESEVAFTVEEVLKDRPSKLRSLEIGYRVHLPYVEVKLNYLSTDAELMATWLKKVDAVLKNVTVARDFADAAFLCGQKIQGVDFTFYDFVSEGYLHSRLAPQLKLLKNWSFKQSAAAPSVDMFAHEDDFLALFPDEDDKCIIVHSLHGTRQLKTIEAPMKAPLMAERRRQYFAEMALVEFSRDGTPPQEETQCSTDF